jgi:hypothetical protein
MRVLVLDIIDFTSTWANRSGPKALEARKILWKLGELAFDNEYAIRPEYYRNPFPMRDKMSDLRSLPILDVASGPRGAYFMRSLGKEKLVLTDVSYFVEAFLNRAKKEFGLGNNITVRRSDLNDFKRLFKERSYRHIRLGNIRTYAEVDPTFYEEAVKRIAPRGTLSMEYYYKDGEEPTVELIKENIRRLEGAWEQSEGTATGMIGEPLYFALFKRKAKDRGSDRAMLADYLKSQENPDEMIRRAQDSFKTVSGKETALFIASGNTSLETQTAKQNAGVNVIASDIYANKIGYQPYYESFKNGGLDAQKAVAEGQSNLAVLRADGVALLSQAPEASLDNIILVNPDDKVMGAVLDMIQDGRLQKVLKPNGQVAILPQNETYEKILTSHPAGKNFTPSPERRVYGVDVNAHSSYQSERPLYVWKGDRAMLAVDKNIDLVKSNGVMSIHELASAIKKAETLNTGDNANVIGSTLFEPDSSLTALSSDRLSDGTMSQHLKLEYILQERTGSDTGIIKFTISFDKISKTPNGLVVLIGKENVNDQSMLKEQKKTLSVVYSALKEIYPDQAEKIVLQNTANIGSLMESSGIDQESISAGQGGVFLSELVDAVQKQQEVGGINLNPANLNLEVHNDGGEIKFNFDPAQVENLKFDGFVPVILNVQPVKDLPLLLGIKEEEGAQQLTMAR